MKDQTMLPIDTDEVRHPMWSGPDPNQPMPDHLRRLLAEISVRLRPYDGRQTQGVGYDMPFVVNYLRFLYETLVKIDAGGPPQPLTANYIWCIGKVFERRIAAVNDIENRLRNPRPHLAPAEERRRQQYLRQQRGTIERVAELLALAVMPADDQSNEGG